MRVTVNAARLSCPSWDALTFFQFDVSFWFERVEEPDPDEAEPKKKKGIPFGVAKELQPKLNALFSSSGGGGFYDMNKIAYSTIPLPSVSPDSAAAREGWRNGEDGKTCVLKLREEPTAKGEQQEITLRQVGDALNMAEFAPGAPRLLGADYRKYIAAMDIALQPDLSVYRCVKGAYYDENRRAAWSAIQKVDRTAHPSPEPQVPHRMPHPAYPLPHPTSHVPPCPPPPSPAAHPSCLDSISGGERQGYGAMARIPLQGG